MLRSCMLLLLSACASSSYTTEHGLNVRGTGLSRNNIEAITELVVSEVGGRDEIRGVYVFLQTTPIYVYNNGNPFLSNGHQEEGRLIAINVTFPHCAESLAMNLVHVVHIKVDGKIKYADLSNIKDKIRNIVCGDQHARNRF